MNIHQADKIAKSLWGSTAFVTQISQINNKSGSKEKFRVGRRIFTPLSPPAYIEMSTGKTPREALRRAKEIYPDTRINRKAYSSHSAVEEPEDKNTSIFRYMTFDRFKDLIEEEYLYFSRMDFMNDSHEGSISELTHQFRHDQLLYSNLPLLSSKSSEYLTKAVSDEISRERYNARRCHFASCWQMSDFDDISMWERYVRKDRNGLAVKSTFSRLTSSFLSSFEMPIVCGKVSYVDYQSEVVDESNGYKLFLQKRSQYASEKELRALLWMPPYKNGFPHSNLYDSVNGIKVKVDLSTLISGFVLSPFNSESFPTEFREILLAKGLPQPVTSSLTKPSVF
jgi:hypothetical protein